MEPSVAILIPVLGRPQRIAPLLRNIREATPEQHRVYFAASDEPTVAAILRDEAESTLAYDSGETYPIRINALYERSREPLLFLCGDDYWFHNGWLPPLLAAMEDLGGSGVCVPNDLHNPNGTCALVSREYVDSRSGCIDIPGVVVNPGYSHNYCDTELFETAAHRHSLRYVPDSVVEHLHPCAGKAETDATYTKGLARLNYDRALYESRRHLWTR